MCHKLQRHNRKGPETNFMHCTFLAWNISQTSLVPYHVRWRRDGKQYYTFYLRCRKCHKLHRPDMRCPETNLMHCTFLAWHISQTLLVSKTVKWHWHCYAGYVMNCSATAVLLHEMSWNQHRASNLPRMTHFSDLVSQETSSCLALSGILLSQSYRQCV